MSREILDKKTWKALRPQLNNSYDYNLVWEKVIKLFRQRINDFYFKPIESILAPQSKKGEGFSILTLQCALIEMFSSFKNGTIYNRHKSANGPSFEYKNSSRCFVDFLHSEEIFENHFYVIELNEAKAVNQPYNANDFYDKVRCGLMHEARTKDDWRITANPQKTPGKNMFIGVDTENNKVVHRTNLHKKLKDYFDNKYLGQLRETNPHGNELRRFLGRKLDHLHSLPKDNLYEWWTDP